MQTLPMLVTQTQEYYDVTLDEAGRLLSVPSEELVSIKIRPLSEWPNEDDYHNAYVYPGEYDEIGLVHSGKISHAGVLGYVQGGPAVRYGDHPDEYLIVTHETGPEIIAVATAIAAGINLTTAVVNIIAKIVETVNKNNEAKKKNDAVRLYKASAISIEIRRKRYPPQRVKVETLPLPKQTIDQNSYITLFQQIPPEG